MHWCISKNIWMKKIDFSSLAEQSFMSPSYFRSIFKDVTGLTPVDYLNRMRIVKSLEYLELDKSTIADAAARVGILIPITIPGCLRK